LTLNEYQAFAHTLYGERDIQDIAYDLEDYAEMLVRDVNSHVRADSFDASRLTTIAEGLGDITLLCACLSEQIGYKLEVIARDSLDSKEKV